MAALAKYDNHCAITGFLRVEDFKESDVSEFQEERWHVRVGEG